MKLESSWEVAFNFEGKLDYPLVNVKVNEVIVLYLRDKQWANSQEFIREEPMEMVEQTWVKPCSQEVVFKPHIESIHQVEISHVEVSLGNQRIATAIVNFYPLPSL